MPCLIDTNVLSERIKQNANKGVLEWLDAQDELAVSMATIYEIEFGIRELQRRHGRNTKKTQLVVDWFATLMPYLTCLPVDQPIAAKAAEFSSITKGHGRQIDVNDMIIAATAVQMGRTLVTRNLKDFDRLPGLTLLNPFH